MRTLYKLSGNTITEVSQARAKALRRLNKLQKLMSVSKRMKDVLPVEKQKRLISVEVTQKQIDQLKDKYKVTAVNPAEALTIILKKLL
tara:strand:+ start:874 stop:1137 length:264 start_codon:yes stop_codon:yes gene_type:complete